ncbi:MULTISPECIES: flagellar export protein FliJ [Shewanella]|jgi:flagellar FliJ protein|uniref:Flagellar FliJ protein n=4 Tax=Shewanella TaxID=22 RepID=A9KWP2_SHEB9|nr:MULTISPECIES: flagellar export protein FliJ [Shewanella]MBU1390997.1 flagellar export protein FliJ [Gammaproteobacteria bacterium]QYX63507.1 flagellar export protein FliJ [Shewanella putrefaciens]ABS09066.1 flagellar export protein FliJ [Shewanella baltica OS185]ABX50229.1 flagellar export protein FliJ [Shewanella baltica OS195]ADT95222.1 flagellar export protein FliJ [Shewanella baltica OS678]
MANADPLLLVLKLANDAEEQAALLLKSAQLECQKRLNQLSALNNYRLEYMKQMQSQQGQAISASHYHQFHRFIRQIDDAITQQNRVVADGEKQKEYRQQHWLEKQKKRKAVELLLASKEKKRQVVEQKREQKMTDEFASQQFYRRHQR